MELRNMEFAIFQDTFGEVCFEQFKTIISNVE